jgi:hypothetical protein
MLTLRRSVVLAAVIAVCLAGCNRGPQLAEVEGTLKLRGKPLPGVMVCFVPEGDSLPPAPRATGWTDDQGRDQLMCDNPAKPGALVGAHRVFVLDPEAFDEVGGGGPEERPATQTPRKKARLQFDMKYMMPGATPLRAEVKTPGPQTIDLDVK